MKLRFINPKQYYLELLKFKNYIRKPVYIVSNDTTFFQNLSGTWTIFIIKTILYIITGSIVTLLIDPVNQTTVRWTELYTTGTIFLLSILILPALEEVAFRLSLKYRPVYLVLTTGVLTYYAITKLVYHTKLTDIENHLEVRLICSGIIMVLSYLIISRVKVNNRLHKFWRSKYPWIFYFFCITFAWMHILNYEINLKHIVLLPLITLPKLVSALTYAYIRVHYGYLFSLGLHMCWNGFGFIMSLLPFMATD